MTLHAVDSAPVAGDLFSLEAEQAVLGALLVDNATLARVRPWLAAEMFSEPLHGRIYTAISGHLEQGLVANPITLASAFPDDPGMKALGGASGYLARLTSGAISVSGMVDYARVVAELWMRREAVAELEAAAGMVKAQSLTLPMERALEPVSEALGRIRADVVERVRPAPSWRDHVRNTIAEIDEEHANPDLAKAWRSGIGPLDDVLRVRRGNLVILAGRPSMGKSAVALEWARHHAMQDRPDRHVMIVSREMSAAEIGARLISRHTRGERVPLHYSWLSDPSGLNEDQMRAMIAAGDATEALPLIIEERATTCGAIQTALAAANKRLEHESRDSGVPQSVGLVVVDYLQLMRASGRTNGRVEMVTEISGGLKALAKDNGIPVLALSQLSRAVENREPPRPQMSDLRDSGSIEQDADSIVLIYRPEYYVSRDEPEDKHSPEHLEWRAAMEGCRGKVDLHIAKQRQGPTKTVTANCDLAQNWIGSE